MPAITSGAELVKMMAESGTGEAKLAPARQLLAEHYEKTGKDTSAAGVIAALEASGAPEMTLDKARQFAGRGEYTGPAQAAAVKIEDVILVAAKKVEEKAAAKK
jgi:hypothetical protein